MNPIIFKNITHKYISAVVLNNISLEIEENLITVMVGRSGGGKSTLLQIINGLIKPTSGEVYVLGKPLDYTRISEIRLQIGYAVQGTSLFPHMTIYENISILGRISNNHINGLNERTDALIKLVNLNQEYLQKYPYQLSGGEQQRVGLCRAIFLNPKIFLLDEAFGALDAITRNEVHAELLKLQKFEPRTIVMVTHDLREALKLGDRIMIVEKGEVQQFGTKDEILNSPANDFVRDFIRTQR